jgi:hypothetical protein
MKSVKNYYKTVDSLPEAKVGKIYSTTNYTMFRTLKYNRGEDNGIDPVRLAKFKKLIAENKFFFSWVNVVINLSGLIVDGHHRFAVLMALGMPINFTITPEPELNVTDEIKLMGAISRLNAVDSKWNAKSHFDVALKSGLPLAIAIAELKAGLSEKYDIDLRILREGRIYALITRDRKGLESRLVNVEDYLNDNVLNEMSSDRFKKEFDFVCRVMEEIKAWNAVYIDSAKINEFFMIRAAMPLVWDNMLNMDMFLEEIKRVKFANVANTKNGCKVYIQKIQKRILGIK